MASLLATRWAPLRVGYPGLVMSWVDRLDGWVAGCWIRLESSLQRQRAAPGWQERSALRGAGSSAPTKALASRTQQSLRGGEMAGTPLNPAHPAAGCLGRGWIQPSSPRLGYVYGDWIQPRGGWMARCGLWQETLTKQHKQHKQQGGSRRRCMCGVLGGNQCRASLLHKQHKQQNKQTKQALHASGELTA